MNALSQILIIDDDYGRNWAKENDGRKHFCIRTGLKDVTGDLKAFPVEDPVAQAIFCAGLKNQGGSAEHDIEGTLAVVRQGWEKSPRWALVLLDLKFITGKIAPNGVPQGRPEDSDPAQYFGLRLLEHMFNDAALKDVPVVILSAMEREKIEERFANHGAWTFEEKDKLTPERVKHLLHHYGLMEDSGVTQQGKTTRIIGHAIPFLKSLREARKRARIGTDTPGSGNNILVIGETGTGKELFSRYIHRISRRAGEFRTLWTVGVPETLVDDRLCGHKKGAFNGARYDQPGEAELADRGTLLIDEFGAIDPLVQPKLLRLLDKNIRQVQRIGDDEVRTLDLHVVIATNELDILYGGGFRGDLLARIGANDPIELPPLRDRKEDIPELVEFFLRKFEKAFGAEKRKPSDEALAKLIAHDWLENVRGLERVIETAVDKWRGLKILSETHLVFGRALKQPATTTRTKIGSSDRERPSPTVGEEGATLETVIAALNSFKPDLNSADAWKGKMEVLQEAYASLLGRLLNAALEKEKTHDGEYEPTPAVRWLMKQELPKKGGSSKAYDIIKKLLHIHKPVLADVLKTHPAVKDVYLKACKERAGVKKSPQDKG